MRLVTWNVNSLKVRLPRLLELLAEHCPDVACLQETKVTREDFPHAELGEAGYAAQDHSGGRWAGVAVIARDGLEVDDAVTGLPGDPPGADARWIEATVGGMRLASVYVPNGRAVGSEFFAAKLDFLRAVAERVGALGDRPLVVAGDFNVARSDLDVYDPAAFVGSTHVTPEERELVQAILDRGLVDTYRELNPDEPGFTWWDYRQGHFHRKMGMRIDLILASRDLAARVARCGIDRRYRKGPKPSDHAPLLLDLEAGP